MKAEMEFTRHVLYDLKLLAICYCAIICCGDCRMCCPASLPYKRGQSREKHRLAATAQIVLFVRVAGRTLDSLTAILYTPLPYIAEAVGVSARSIEDPHTHSCRYSCTSLRTTGMAQRLAVPGERHDAEAGGGVEGRLQGESR
jgi:hypothetical protein